MNGKPRDENKFTLDMPFGEALERFIAVKPSELEANVAASKKKKPPRAKVKKRKAPGGKKKSPNVISLKDRKTSLRRRGLA